MAQTIKPADKVYLFVAPRSAWNKIYICVVCLFAETGNVTVQSGPVSIVLTNILQILTACDSTEVDVLPQVRNNGFLHGVPSVPYVF